VVGQGFITSRGDLRLEEITFSNRRLPLIDAEVGRNLTSALLWTRMGWRRRSRMGRIGTQILDHLWDGDEAIAALQQGGDDGWQGCYRL